MKLRILHLKPKKFTYIVLVANECTGEAGRIHLNGLQRLDVEQIVTVVEGRLLIVEGREARPGWGLKP